MSAWEERSQTSNYVLPQGTSGKGVFPTTRGRNLALILIGVIFL